MEINIQDVSMIYPNGKQALKNLNLNLKSPSLVGLLGPNGAGKSTLMKLLVAALMPTIGSIQVDGQPLDKTDQLLKSRLGYLPQDFGLFEELTVTQFLDYMAALKGVHNPKPTIQEAIHAVNLEEKARTKIHTLSGGQRQRVGIAQALLGNPPFLIFDEPTAVLTPQEIDELMEIMRGFKAEGKSILFITHKLNEIMAVADRCTVLRKGKYIGTVDIANSSKEELSRMMVGRDVEFVVDKKPAQPGKTILSVQDMTVPSRTHKKDAVRNVSFDVRAGEIVCLAGIEGNGQTELVYGLTGLEKISGGTITLDGQDITHASIRQRSKDGMSHIPEDRHKHGLVLDYTLEKNMVLQRYWQPQFQHNGFIKADEVRKYSDHLIEQYDVRSGQGSVTIARSMSGGNQQKAIIAREIDKDPKLLVAVQPTRGLDVGAIEYIHKQIVAQRDAGKAVLLVSLELDEVMNLSDRILVMYEGEIVGEFDPKTTTVQELGLYMAGAKKKEAK